MAVYGALSKYPTATLEMPLASAPSEGAQVILTGMDDELPTRTPIRVTVNGQTIFEGPSPFPNWDGVGECDNPVWTPVTLPIPPGALHAGDNQITIADLASSDAFNAPPYMMISDTALVVSG